MRPSALTADRGGVLIVLRASVRRRCTHTPSPLSSALAPQFSLVALSFPPSIPPLSFHHCHHVPPTCLPHPRARLAMLLACVRRKADRRSTPPPLRRAAPLPGACLLHQNQNHRYSTHAVCCQDFPNTDTWPARPAQCCCCPSASTGTLHALKPFSPAIWGPKKAALPFATSSPSLLLAHACTPAKFSALPTVPR